MKLTKIPLIILVLFIFIVLWAQGWLNVPDRLRNKIWQQRTCNVQTIKLYGTLISTPGFDASESSYVYASNIQQDIYKADADKNIKAIILDVNSNGGTGTAGEEVADALKQAKKPTVAMIRSGADSDAYWAASGAQRIFAYSGSQVGDIGVTFSYTDNSIQNKENGITFHQLSSGKFKDIFDTDKPLTSDEEAMIMQDVKRESDYFVTAVATNRNLDPKLVQKMSEISYPLLGQQALEQGLVDQIGGPQEVQEYLQQKTGVKPLICW